VQPPAATSPQTAQAPEHGAHKRRKFLAVAVLILLLLLAVAAYFYFSRPQPTEQTSLPVTTEEEVVESSPTPLPENLEEEVEAIDTGDPEPDLTDLDQDVNQL
jgi:hypothetical protein